MAHLKILVLIKVGLKLNYFCQKNLKFLITEERLKPPRNSSSPLQISGYAIVSDSLIKDRTTQSFEK